MVLSLLAAGRLQKRYILQDLEYLFHTGKVPTMTTSVSLPAGAVAAGQVPGERGGDRTDREERLREERIPIEEATKREPAICTM